MRSIWKGKYSDPRFDTVLLRQSEKKELALPGRGSTILQGFVDRKVRVPIGRGYLKFTIKDFMVGHKFGEYAHTKLMGRAIHERRKKKK